MLLQDRLKKGRERLDNALEAVALLCEPVEPPKGELEHIHYFCGNTEIPDRPEGARSRSALRSTRRRSRSCAPMPTSPTKWSEAGYSDEPKSPRIKAATGSLRQAARDDSQCERRNIDLKTYEADMRHLIDTYIEADEPRKISPFDDMGLLDLIVKTGIADAIAAKLGGLERQQGRNRGNDREQRPQQDHQGAPERPGVLREDVGVAG